MEHAITINYESVSVKATNIKQQLFPAIFVFVSLKMDTKMADNNFHYPDFAFG